MGERYSVVFRSAGKETGRSQGMGFEEALGWAKRINRTIVIPLDHSYVETTASVKHLPLVEVGR